ncbi:FtsK/SpoIIIE family protein [uncultured Mycobacterium sp.]|uniref:FtsK/SpoIIIE family protein n=1 Tax=uncultured Mycobacterium sp. TaxID=171292 RepID=A0A1Y5PA26_9MYCO|nr:FtsK/SpoIIIE family protein [uncultured Mycobacterium sp.]
MQLKIILRRADGSHAQLAITADATASIGDLATALVDGDPERRSATLPVAVTLKLEHSSFDSGTPGRVLDPRRNLIDSGIRSGATVSVTPAPASPAPRSRHGRSVAVLRVLTGPDAGREFPLSAGNSRIGIALTSDVLLSDPSLSDLHAAISVGDTIEISNLAGPNGVLVGGVPTQRAVIGATDTVRLGSTELAVLPTVRSHAVQTDSSAIEFNRSPRVVARFAERRFAAPPVPPRPEPQHLPIVSMLLPLVMGLALLVTTRSLLSVLFVALSPLLMIGMYFDTRRQEKKRREEAIKRFAESLRGLAEELTTAQRVERATRLAETPALSQTVEAIHRLGPLLWTHRPETPEFLSFRLGLGDAPSRCVVDIHDGQDGDAQYATQLTQLRDEFALISEVPIVADLRECGALGVCGPRGLVDGVARGIVMQLVGLHSPADVAVAAFSSPQARQCWEWLEWLPHAGSVHSPLTGNHLTESASGAAALLARLEDLVKKRRESIDTAAPVFGVISEDTISSDGPPQGVLPAVVVVVEDTAPIDRPRLTRLAEHGATVGVHVIWVATEVTSLPAACRTFLLVDNATAGSTVGEVRRGRHTFPIACETLDIPDSVQVALLLAPVVDVGAAVEDETDLPRSVSYVTLAGAGLAGDPATVTRDWLANESVSARRPRNQPSGQPITLRALVGSTGTADFHLDLREHGPHALVGGTTGSGKSEFLQTWVLGMAAAHSPDRVTFLFVDYKGGAAFADCVHLPHTVGLVTDLSPHLVRRALTSLRAEIRRREELLNLKGAKDLVTLEQSGDPDTPPSLIIIVDEFAALVSEVPEFVDGVIDVAQRGRSLGLHLILATQRPAGVIKDNLRANTNLRIALRLNDADDSVDVIEDPLAAHFPLGVPGRAVAKTGPGRLTVFQSGYVGGVSSDEPQQASIDVCEFVFGRRRQWLTSVAAARNVGGPTDIRRIVATIRSATEALAIAAPRRPWLPPLAPVYALEKLAGFAHDEQLVIGQADWPDAQAQRLGVFNPDRDGNMAIIGTGGSGKSTVLRTLAVSAALAPGGAPVHVYGFDFGSGSLRMLDGLPHVAAIVDASDDERIGRVLRRLTALLDERSAKFSRAHASDIAQYRQLTGEPEPRILLLVDSIGAFREAYEHASRSPYFGMFTQLAADGRMLGIHVIVTADRPGALSASLSSTIQRRLVLRLASDDDYGLAGVSFDVLSAASPPGRGVMDGQEVQVAVFGGDANTAVQGRAIAHLAEAMHEKGFQEPEPIVRLAEQIPLYALPATAAPGSPAIGLANETLEPVGVNPHGVFMVTGPPGSGRTTAVMTLAQAVRRANPGIRLVYLAPAASTATGAGEWDDVVVGPARVAEYANELMARLPGDAATTLMVVIESVADFGGTEAENDLTRLVKTLNDASVFVVGESGVSSWSQAWQLAQPFKSARRGIVLAPDGTDTDSLLSTSIGHVHGSYFPPGRGILIERGKGTWLHVAQPTI